MLVHLIEMVRCHQCNRCETLVWIWRRGESVSVCGLTGGVPWLPLRWLMEAYASNAVSLIKDAFGVESDCHYGKCLRLVSAVRIVHIALFAMMVVCFHSTTTGCLDVN